MDGAQPCLFLAGQLSGLEVLYSYSRKPCPNLWRGTLQGAASPVADGHICVRLRAFERPGARSWQHKKLALRYVLLRQAQIYAEPRWFQ